MSSNLIGRTSNTGSTACDFSKFLPFLKNNNFDNIDLQGLVVLCMFTRFTDEAMRIAKKLMKNKRLRKERFLNMSLFAAYSTGLVDGFKADSEKAIRYKNAYLERKGTKEEHLDKFVAHLREKLPLKTLPDLGNIEEIKEAYETFYQQYHPV